MLFNSIDFAVFLPIVFGLYWWIGPKRIMAQNALIVAASYIFYGWWDWRFLSLIAFSTIVDFMIGRTMATTEDVQRRRLLLAASLVVNLGLLGFFKYYDFFLDNFVQAFSLMGQDLHASSLRIILPVGISFYTFQTLSYTIDVYRRDLEPSRDLISFAAYVSFFPQLVAGPIERATHLLPQFRSQRRFDRRLAVDGLRQVLWGLFKKVVIADNCARLVDAIFAQSVDLNGSTLLLGAIFFAFQIYGDFSGYSDIAIGTARLFGFDLMRNFAFPYFSRDIAEFWRRWHISLSTWFRDYLYIPLGGSRGGTWMKVRNTFVIFLVSGFWHGANWTFVVWGGLNALYFLPLLLTKRNRRHLDIVAKDRWFPGLRDLWAMGSTFLLTVLAWVFFRAESVSHAVAYLKGMASPTLFERPTYATPYVVVLIVVFLIIEWLGRDGQYAIERLGLTWPRPVRWTFYYVLAMCILLFVGSEQEFIYFQF